MSLRRGAAAPVLTAALAVLILWPAVTPAAPGAPCGVRLAVPVVRQAPERCGPAALAMVLRYYHAPDSVVARADQAYSRALRGTLITDLATIASRVGHPASIETPDEDSLRALLRSDVPPILLYQSGRGPVTRPHYGVVVGWDPARGRYRIHDGGGGPREFRRADLRRRWRAAGAQALIVRRAPS